MFDSEVPSLRRKRMQQRSADAQVAALRTAQRVGRTTQAAHSTIAVGEADVPLVDAVDTAVTVGTDLPGVEGEAGQAGADSWEAWEKAQDAGEGVDVALAAAEAASEEAIAAKTTADGKNRVFAQMIEPVAHPEIPFVAGDLWYETDSSGRFVNVHVWNETEAGFVQHRIVASSVLVPGSVGPVLIEDGAVTGAKIAATAIDGKTITGALMRTAASGQRMQFDTSGLTAYNLAGVQTSRLSSNNGAFNLTGGLTCTASSAESTSYGPNTIYAYSGEPSAKITHFYASREGGLSWVPPAASGVGTSSIRPADDVTPDMQLRSPRGLTLRAGTGSSDDVSVLGSGLFRSYMPRSQFDGVTSFIGETRFFDAVWFDGDTEWANATLPAGVTGTARWRRYLGIIYVQFNVTSSTVIAENGVLSPAFTLPPAAWPEVNTGLNAVGSGTWGTAAWVSAATGACTIRNLRTGSVGVSQFYGSGQWPAPGL